MERRVESVTVGLQQKKTLAGKKWSNNVYPDLRPGNGIFSVKRSVNRGGKAH